MKRAKLIILYWLELPMHIANICIALIQIYGEINRIRLIMSENSERGKTIEKFDREQNKYIPFFDKEENYKNYKAMKDIQK